MVPVDQEVPGLLWLTPIAIQWIGDWDFSVLSGSGFTTDHCTVTSLLVNRR